MDKRVLDKKRFYESRLYDYDSWSNNIYFLERIKLCLKGEATEEQLNGVLMQLDSLIMEEKDKIKRKEGGKSCEPMLVRS